ncbi:MAG: hypothetical protein KIT84_38175 [Labilithrix sp.]|nr:hypothetical protein [Labilithrix sp.]MCW5816887.1 hypothetical protein [Labilithrix sp.]
MSRRAKRLGLAGVGAAVVAACGYLPMEQLPLAEDGLTAEGGIGDGATTPPGLADGGVDPTNRDASNPGDDDDDDAGDPRIDASDDDAGCRHCDALFVWESGGDDDGAGTPEAPFKTLKRAFDAVTNGGRKVTTIYVASGKYDDAVTLIDGVSMSGAWTCDAANPPCKWETQDFANKSHIANQTNAGVVVPKEVTRATRFTGFRVVGVSGNVAADQLGSVGMTVAGSPRLVENELYGGDLSLTAVGVNRRSIGLLVTGSNDAARPGPYVEDCTLAGQTADHSIGLLFETPIGGSFSGGFANAFVTRSDIRSGPAVTSVAVVANNTTAATVLDDNTIVAGPSSSDDASVGGSWAVDVRAPITIDRNRIHPPGPSQGPTPQCRPAFSSFCGGVRVVGAAAVLTNNFIGGVRAPLSVALLLTDNANLPSKVVVNGNVIDGGGNRDEGKSAAIVVKNTHRLVLSLGHVRNNILLGGVARRRYHVYEDAALQQEAHLADFAYNDLFHVPPEHPGDDFAYRTWDNGVEHLLSFDKLTEVKVPTIDVRTLYNEDPKLTALVRMSNPNLVNAGSPNDIDDPDAPDHDFENEQRTRPIDIGADEIR